MKDLIKRHHVAMWESGMIDYKMSVYDFIARIDFEVDELHNSIDNFGVTNEAIEASVDLCATIMDMVKFYNYDFIQEYRKRVEFRENKLGK